MALLAEPKFLLLDEPMNGLDPEGVVLMRNLIKTLNEQGITFLISSHMLSELSKVATRYGFIHRGVLIKEITQEELRQSVTSYTVVSVEEKDINKALNVFKKAKYEYKEDGKNILVYEKALQEIVLLLSKNNIEVKDILKETGTIENYYLNLIGGLK